MTKHMLTTVDLVKPVKISVLHGEYGTARQGIRD